MPLPTLPYYATEYQARPALLRGTVQRPLLVSEFTESCEVLLAWARHYRCHFWLIDGRADVAHPTDLYDWTREEFMPRVHRALGLIPCVAFVGLPSLWHDLRVRHYAPPPPALHSAVYRANWFTAEAEALAWLAQFRPAAGAQ